jgi:hypothetical protein
LATTDSDGHRTWVGSVATQFVLISHIWRMHLLWMLLMMILLRLLLRMQQVMLLLVLPLNWGRD